MDGEQSPLEGVGGIWDHQRVHTGTYHEETSFTFHGEAVEGGQMGAAEFGQALIGYSAMVGEVSRTLSPKAGGTELKVTGVHEGSFTALLSVAVGLSTMDAVREWFGSDTAALAAQALGMSADAVETMGGIAGVVVGAVKAGQWLRGRRIAKRERLDEIHDKIVTDDGDALVALAKSVDVLGRPKFRKGVRDFTEPLMHAGIESVTVGARNDSAELGPADRSSFLEDPEEGDRIEVSPMRLKVERVAFDGAAWRFTHLPSDGGVAYSFSARIDDERFLDDVASRRLVFGDGDEIDAIVEVTIPGVPQRGHRQRFRITSVRQVYYKDDEEPDGFLTPDGTDLREDS